MPSFSRILAVDMGASAVRLVEVGPDSRGRPAVLALSEEEVPQDPAKGTDSFPLYASALAGAVAKLRSPTRRCVLCLGGPAVFARILKMPAADPARVRSMIGFEAQQTVPAIEQAWWDYQLLPSPEPGEVEALILAIKRETVEEMAAAAASAGLIPQTVTLAPAALLNAFFFNQPDLSVCHLILEIGARATTILLVEGSRVFVRVVPLGGAAVSQAIATDLQESFAGAEVLKRAKGFVHPGGAYEDPSDPSAARISKLARGVMTRLHTEVERSATFFRSQQGGGKPTHAWLTGAGAMLGYSDLFFREKLRIPIEFLQPFRRLSLPGGGVADSVSRHFPGWSTVVGAALQGLPDAPVRINVLGGAGKALLEARRDRPAVAVALATGAALCLLPGIHGFWQASKTHGELERESARVEEAARVLQKLDSQNKRFLASAQRLEMALQLEEERLRWPRLLEELKRHCPPRLWVTSLAMIPAAAAVPEGGGAAKSISPPVPMIEITGMFETQSEKADAEAVAKFQKALADGGVLKKVVILERETPQYLEGKTDQVALKFRLQAEWPWPATEKSAGLGGGT